MTNKIIRFLLNGNLVSIDDGVETTLSVLNYLRINQGLTGSKEGCAEGDCGACTVVIGELENNCLQLRAVNACIQFVPTLDGKALFTVEYLRQANGNLHPVQQAMVDHHGSQCGFCTPGFVMSLWSVYVRYQANQTRPSREQIRSALSGNLCRCTGYRPILDAADDMLNLTEVKFDASHIEEALRKIQNKRALHYVHAGSHFHAPKSLKHLAKLRSDKPDATLLAGSTDIGLWVNKQFKNLDDIIYLGEVKELKQMHENETDLSIACSVTLTDALCLISQYYPEINQQWERFASVPIRNAGTLGGNIANGSPIGDSMPWLIVLGARILLRNADGQRSLALEDLYVDYMEQAKEQDEFIEAIIVPKPQSGQLFRTYKLSKRYDSDISAVCAAFRITLQDTIISEIRIAFGGMAATPKRACNTEQLLSGKIWNEENAQKAMKSLADDYSPLSDMRASAQNRAQSAENLLYRFFLETRPHDPLAEDQVSVFS